MKYAVRFEGHGSGINDRGIVRVIGGQAFFCDGNLIDYIRRYDGCTVEVAFWTSDDFEPFTMDPLIVPLVEAIQRRGITTLSSCQGHVGKEDATPYPFVSVYGKPDIPVASGWTIEAIGTGVYRLRPNHRAVDEDDLKEMQASIHEQVSALA